MSAGAARDDAANGIDGGQVTIVPVQYDPSVLRRHLLGAENAHQVGGHAGWIQYDARDEARRLAGSGADWNLLWQVGSDDATGFQWGDMGNLYLLVRDSDAREGRFERARLVLQCG